MTTSTSRRGPITRAARRSITHSVLIAISRKANSRFDASILGGHLVPADTKLTWPLNPDPSISGVVVTMKGVSNTAPGQKPVVAFTLADVNGNALAPSALSSFSFTMTGPTTDYGYTNFGSGVTTPGYVSESAGASSQCSSAGACTYTFQHAIPSGADWHLRHRRRSGAHRNRSAGNCHANSAFTPVPLIQ